MNTDSSSRAIVLARVSTEEQSKKGYSIDSQFKAAQEYARKNNLQIIDEIQEKASASKVSIRHKEISDLSDSLSNRPQLQKILDRVKKKDFSHLIVYTRDRLARNLEIYLALNHYFSKHDITVHFSRIGEKISAESDVLNNFIEIVMGNVAELEANLIATRVREGQEQCVKSNTWPGGKAPYGYIVAGKETKYLAKSSEPQPTVDVKTIFHLYTNQGYSMQKIADEMKRNYPLENWTKGKVEAILNNSVYTGIRIWGKRSRRRSRSSSNDNIVEADYAKELALITQSDWEKTAIIKSQKSKNKDPKYYSTPFLLKGKLVCGECEQVMRTRNYGRRSGHVYLCSHHSGSTLAKTVLKKELIEDLFLKELSNLGTRIATMNFAISFRRSLHDRRNEMDLHFKAMEDTIKNKRRLMQKITTSIKDYGKKETTKDSKKPPSEDYNTIKEVLESEQAYLKKEINLLEDHLRAIKEKFRACKNRDLDDLKTQLKEFFDHDFENLDCQTKRRLIDSLVDRVILTKNADGLTQLDIAF